MLVSHTAGFSVPMTITPTGGTAGNCETAACGTDEDILANCDSNLIMPKGGNDVCESLIALIKGKLRRGIDACASACTAGIEFGKSTSLHATKR